MDTANLLIVRDSIGSRRQRSVHSGALVIGSQRNRVFGLRDL